MELNLLILNLETQEAETLVKMLKLNNTFAMATLHIFLCLSVILLTTLSNSMEDTLHITPLSLLHRDDMNV